MKYLEGIPEILYKYRDYSNEYNRKTLFNFELFLASTSMFNDPYEGAIPFVYEEEDLTPDNVFKKLYELAKHDNPDWDETQIHEFCFNAQRDDLMHDEVYVDRFNEQNRIEIDKSFGILSLTIHPTNYLMWSHYGNSHNGFCLGFDKTILYETVNGSISPVKYDTELPKLKLFGDAFDFHLKQLCTKSKVWEYEDEYRIVKAKAAKQMIKYPKEMIKQIFLGCNLPQKERDKIIEFVKANDIDCEIHELSLNKKEFTLNDLRIF